MIRPHPLLQIDVAEQAALVRIVAAHRRPPVRQPEGISDAPVQQPFSAAC
jgi:hypothetical protein